MPRPKRIHYEGAIYHVTSRGNERRKIVLDDADRGMFLSILAENLEQHQVVCHAWVMMDNHYHLLLETPAPNLSLAMKHVNGIYTQKFNKRHHRVGHLFQGRYKSIVVEKDSYLKELCRYVVSNPVRAKMVKLPGDWKWSSYRGTAGLSKPDKWLETDWILSQFGSNKPQAQKAYTAFVADGIGSKESPWDNLYSRIYLGGKEFLDSVHEVGKKHGHLDVPKYQKHVVKQAPEKVIAQIAKAYGEKPEEILKGGRKRFEARDVAIYLLKRECGLSLKEIGKKMGIGPTAAGNRWVRIKQRLTNDKGLAQKIEKWIMVA
jgi:REP element-mobilizing transposase RayT